MEVSVAWEPRGRRRAAARGRSGRRARNRRLVCATEGRLRDDRARAGLSARRRLRSPGPPCGDAGASGLHRSGRTTQSSEGQPRRATLGPLEARLLRHTPRKGTKEQDEPRRVAAAHHGRLRGRLGHVADACPQRRLGGDHPGARLVLLVAARRPRCPRAGAAHLRSTTRSRRRKKRMDASPSAEAAVVSAGLAMAHAARRRPRKRWPARRRSSA